LYSDDKDPVNETQVDKFEERSSLPGKISKASHKSRTEISIAKMKINRTRFLINKFRSLSDVIHKVIKKKSEASIIALKQSLKTKR
jgi:hypothetical protein